MPDELSRRTAKVSALAPRYIISDSSSRERGYERADSEHSRRFLGRRISEPAVFPKKLYKIGEVMRYSGLTRQTIHNYTHFGLIREEERTDSGHRLYGEDVFPRLERILALKRAGKSLREIARLFEEGQVDEAGQGGG